MSKRAIISLLFVLFFFVFMPVFADERSEASNPNEAVSEVSLPKSLDLRPVFEKWNLSRRNQGPRGTCSIFALLGAMEYAVGKHQGETAYLSVEYANWAKNQRSRRAPNDGGMFSDLWQGYLRHGLCKESKMPYQEQFDPKDKPDEEAKNDAERMRQIPLLLHWIKQWDSSTGLTGTQFESIQRALARNWPVALGLRWPKEPAWKEDVLQMVPAEDVVDGHSILVVGYHNDETVPGGGFFIVRNTNQPSRDEYMTYEYAKTYTNDALFVESSSDTNH